MRRRRTRHRLGGLLLANHARVWGRLRFGLVIASALTVLLGLGSLMDSALHGDVADSAQKALAVLAVLVAAVVLYRLMALPGLVAQFRERIARLNHRIHQLEAASRHAAPQAAPDPRIGLTSATLEAQPAFVLRAAVSVHEQEPGDAVADTQPCAEAALHASESGPSPASDKPASNVSDRVRLCEGFRQAVAARDLAAALAIGRELRTRFPQCRQAAEFSAIEAALEARLPHASPSCLAASPAADGGA